MDNKSATLPHWDMTPFYPDLQSPEFAQAAVDFKQHVDDLVQLFDDRQIGARGRAPTDAQTVQAFDTVIERMNAVLDEAQKIGGYITAFVDTDSRNDVAQARLSEYRQTYVKLAQLNTRLTAWLGDVDAAALIDASAVAQEHAYLIRRAQVEAQHLMSPAEEALAAEMRVTGSQAWQRLWQDLTSQIMAPFEQEGKTSELPMSALRNLANDPSRAVRRRAYEAELAAWERHAVALAAAMNGVKGEVTALAARRAWRSPLEAALFGENIDRAVLDAMLQAARASFPIFRRYMQAKARLLGVGRLAFYDLFAPVGAQGSAWRFDDAADFIRTHFATFSPRLRGLAERAFAERWIDAEPRAGKRGGGYCMSPAPGQSRVFVNYMPNLDGVSTLAHELGHAYHNLARSTRTHLQRRTPMVLAETASTFCETIVTRAALKQAPPAEQVAILEADLQGATQIVVDISSRFLFEQGVFEKRAQRELSVDELNGLMVQAQKDTYGDGLDAALLHPYMWAVKPHYYMPERNFYNFPYMYGLLFGLGLYALYEKDPDTFRASYDDLLSATGLADAPTLAARYGIDVRSPDFWRSSLAVIGRNVEWYETLASGRSDGS